MIDISKLLKSKTKLVFGKSEVIRYLNEGKLSEVLLSSNFPGEKEITARAKLSDAEVKLLKHTNDELGALCKKPYSISIIGLIK